MNPLANMIVKSGYTPEQAENMTNFYLALADFRYRMYLDWLVSLGNTPTESWPKPPWYVMNFTINSRYLLFQGCCSRNACPYALSS
jgi:hypothetical protein